jgi:hypothetical protein
MAGYDGGRPSEKQIVKVFPKGFFGKFKRGAIFNAVGMVLCGLATLVIPVVPLVVAVAVGGVAGGAAANATGE